jgi:hypothetical protein
MLGPSRKTNVITSLGDERPVGAVIGGSGITIATTLTLTLLAGWLARGILGGTRAALVGALFALVGLVTGVIIGAALVYLFSGQRGAGQRSEVRQDWVLQDWVLMEGSQELQALTRYLKAAAESLQGGQGEGSPGSLEIGRRPGESNGRQDLLFAERRCRYVAEMLSAVELQEPQGPGS